jgi:hypothetical protein
MAATQTEPTAAGHREIGFIDPRNQELFHLRLLLLSVRESYDDLRTIDGCILPTFHQTCLARGLLRTDDEWERCLTEADSFKMPG